MEEYEADEAEEVDSVDEDVETKEEKEDDVEVDADDSQVDWWGKDSAPSYW